jgi:hypothetical protein
MSAAAASGAAAAAEDDALTVAGGVCIECGGMELLTACMQGAWHHHLGGGEREREGEGERERERERPLLRPGCVRPVRVQRAAGSCSWQLCAHHHLHGGCGLWWQHTCSCRSCSPRRWVMAVTAVTAVTALPQSLPLGAAVLTGLYPCDDACSCVTPSKSGRSPAAAAVRCADARAVGAECFRPGCVPRGGRAGACHGGERARGVSSVWRWADESSAARPRLLSAVAPLLCWPRSACRLSRPSLSGGGEGAGGGWSRPDRLCAAAAAAAAADADAAGYRRCATTPTSRMCSGTAAPACAF